MVKGCGCEGNGIVSIDLKVFGWISWLGGIAFCQAKEQVCCGQGQGQSGSVNFGFSGARAGDKVV